MLSLIITLLIVVALVAFFRSLSTEERSIVTKGTFNVLGASVVYGAKATRATLKASYDVGSIAGMKVSLENQETLNSIDSFNKDIAAKGGHVKVAVVTANRHSDDLGITDQLNNIADMKSELEAKLALARAARS